MPQASRSTGIPASEVTQSSTTSAPASRAARAIASTGWHTPVEVSACTNATNRGRTLAIVEVKANERVPYWVTDTAARLGMSVVRISKYCQSIEAHGLAPRSVFHLPVADDYAVRAQAVASV